MGQQKSDAMRHSTASFMRWRRCAFSISRWQLDLSALLASLQEEDGAATNKKTLADYARALSGEDE